MKVTTNTRGSKRLPTSLRRTVESQLRVESLEGRLVLSASVDFGIRDGVVRIVGTEASDVVVVEQQGRRLEVSLSTPDGDIRRNLPLRSVRSIRFDALGGDDRFTNQSAIPAVVFGGGGNDTIRGGRGADSLFGGAGDDSIKGGPGNDRIHGDAGDDELEGGGGADLVRGGTGDDVQFFSFTAPQSGVLTVQLLPGADGRFVELYLRDLPTRRELLEFEPRERPGRTTGQVSVTAGRSYLIEVESSFERLPAAFTINLSIA